MAKKQNYKNISKKGDYTMDDLDCALDCLVEAVEITKDKELMKLVKERAQNRENIVRSVQDIRKIANALNEKESEEEK